MCMQCRHVELIFSLTNFFLYIVPYIYNIDVMTYMNSAASDNNNIAILSFLTLQRLIATWGS